MMTDTDLGTPAPTNSYVAAARSYRANAAAERGAADAEILPNRRAMHLRSAEVWDDRAKAIEDMLAFRQVNEATKAQPLATFAGRASRDNTVESADGRSPRRPG